MLVFTDLTCGYGATPVVHGVSMAVGAGELVAVVGPNGAGKTTLVRAAAGLLRPTGGTVTVDGRSPTRVARRELARTLAYLPQRYELAFPFTAEQVVLMGRYAHQRGPGLDSDADLAVARAAMDRCDVTPLAQRRFDTLSGGERRRVVLAQALCQGAGALLFDEPTAALDPAHAIAVMTALAAERDRGAAVLIVTHDLDLAAGHADRVVVLERGRLVADAPPGEAFAAAPVAAAFGVTLHTGVVAGTRYVVAR